MLRSIAAFVLVVASAGTAHADDARVVLTSGDAELRGTLTAAFEPVGISLIVDAQAATSAAEVLAKTRELSARQKADAVIWLLPANGNKATLLVVERDGNRLLSRDLGHGPVLTASQALDVARVVLTMLRALSVVPEPGAVSNEPPTPKPKPRPRPKPKSESPEPTPVVIERSPRRPSRLSVDLGTSVRSGAASSDVDGRAELGVAVRLSVVEVAVFVGLSRAAEIDAAEFRGELRDDDVAALVRWSPVRAGRFHLGLGGGFALHVARLSGELGPDALRVRETRFDPAVRVELRAMLRAIGPVEVGLTVTSDARVRRQQFLAGDEGLLTLPYVLGTVGLQLRVPVF